MSTVQESAVLVKIRSRGYWKVVIRPTTFQARRIASTDDLFPIVEKNSVRFRIWDYPRIDRKGPPQCGDDWAGQECDCQNEIELWRLYLSGQFVHFFAMAEDWMDQTGTVQTEPERSWGRHLYYLHTLYSLVEIFEFAARLALSPAGDGTMRVEIEIKGLEERQVIMEFPLDHMPNTRCGKPAEASDWKFSQEYPQAELIARPRELAALAALAAQDLFEKFGMNVSLDILREQQQRIGR
jgi:hypothetical protein